MMKIHEKCLLVCDSDLRKYFDSEATEPHVHRAEIALACDVSAACRDKLRLSTTLLRQSPPHPHLKSAHPHNAYPGPW
jgi:hypothetical protein